MAVIKLYSNNPEDGTSTFNKVKWYEATDSIGTGKTALVDSEGHDVETDIDISTAETIHPGFTTYTHYSGDTDKYYASTWYNSSSGVETDPSDWIKGGEDRWDEKFKQELEDKDELVWDADIRKQFKKNTLEELFPDFYRTVIDTSLTVKNEAGNVIYTYTVPYGIFQISEVGVGTVNTTSSTEARDFKIIKADYWTFEKNQLHFATMSGINNGETIRIIGQKKFLGVGEVPEHLDALAMLHLKMQAYLYLADDYPRFKTWAQLQEGSKVSFENLRVHAREFERKFESLLKKKKENPYATLM